MQKAKTGSKAGKGKKAQEPKLEKAREPSRKELPAKKEEDDILDESSDDDDWDDELDDEEQEPEEIDESKVTFTALKNLASGMEHVNIKATIDFVGGVQGQGYGEDPFAIGFLKDDTGEIKMTFWGEDIKKAKKGRKVRVINCSVGEFRGQIQLYPDRKRGVEFV
jgi:hypothetical protein